MEKTKAQDDAEVLAYQFRNEKEGQEGKKAVAFGSPIYLGKGATDLGIGFSEVNQMVANHEAVCFLNGTLNVWKLSTSTGEKNSNRKIALSRIAF